MSRKKEVWFFALLIMCSIIPISMHSLWLDEAWTVVDFALKPTFKELINSLLGAEGGDSQFPGYNIYLWLWVRVFGISEIAVRAANLPFFLLALLYTYYYLPRNNRFKAGFLLLICLSPFIWFYLNESRYIISTFSFSLLALVAVISYFESDELSDKRFTMFVLLSSITLGVAFMMLFVFALIPLAFIVFYYLNQRQESLKGFILKWRGQLSIFLVFAALLGMYYIYTLLKGAGGMRLNPGLNNIIFVLYDFVGFGGIGPPREVLRENAHIDLNSLYFVKTVLLSLIYMGFLVIIFLNLKRSKPDKLTLYGLTGLLVSMTLFFVFAKFFHFKFLSRHVVFIYPSFLFFTYTLLYEAINQYKKTGVILVILLIGALIYSDLNLRFNPAYQKANGLKGCIVAAREVKDERVLWIADVQVFKYYVMKRDLVKGLDPQKVIFVYDNTEEGIVQTITPFINKEKFLVVVINKRDYKKIVRDFLLSASYQIVYKDKDFTMYRSPEVSQ